MTKFLERLEADVQSRRLILERQKILVGVSGGLDSMTLLYALQSLAKKRRWKIIVAHFNHQLRGRHSDLDEKFVCKMTAALALPFVVGRADVKQFAKKSKLSIEMAARKLRHEFFARAAQERKISAIVLAHHASDQVELFFLRLLRGAGGEGLAGMKWCAPSPANPKINLVRPLLAFSKNEISAFSRAEKIPFRNDATNFSNDFLRNRLRNELLPLLLENYQPGLAKTVLRLMEIVGAETEHIGRIARDWLKQRRPDFDQLPIAVQRRVLQYQLTALKVFSDFDMIESLRQAEEVAVSLDFKHSLLRDVRGTVRLQKNLREVDFDSNERIINLNRTPNAQFGGTDLKWQFNTRTKNLNLQKGNAREVFDADRIGGRIILRHWRPGDRFQPIGTKTPAKLQDLFINAKIPRERRRDLVVATVMDGEIFWVENLRISENFKLTKNTNRQLLWRWHRKDHLGKLPVPKPPVKVLYTATVSN